MNVLEGKCATFSEAVCSHNIFVNYLVINHCFHQSDLILVCCLFSKTLLENTILTKCYISIPPENVRKRLVTFSGGREIEH